MVQAPRPASLTRHRDSSGGALHLDLAGTTPKSSTGAGNTPGASVDPGAWPLQFLPVTSQQQETVRIAVGAINAWLGSSGDLDTLNAYIEGLAQDGDPDLELQLSKGLAVVGGILVRRLAKEKGTDPHRELADIVWMTEQHG